MDDSKFIMLEENSEDMVGIELDEDKHQTNLDNILTENPGLFAKELQQIKQSQKMHHKM